MYLRQRLLREAGVFLRDSADMIYIYIALVSDSLAFPSKPQIPNIRQSGRDDGDGHCGDGQEEGPGGVGLHL